MSAAAVTHDALLPRAPGGNGAGAALAVVVHLGLLAALTSSIDWRSQSADVVSAELWASVPQVAAPKPEEVAPQPTPAPPPPAPAPAPRVEAPPPAPDIAIEQQRRKLEADKKKAAAEEQQRVEAENKKKTEAERKKREQETKLEEQRLAEQREAQLRRMMGQAGEANPRSTGTAAQDAAPSAAYAGKVAALIRRASVFTGTVNGNPAAEVEVTSAASGTIIARRLVKSSGSKAWDDAVLQAIDKAGALPRDSDGRVPAKIIIAFRPNEQ